MTATRAAVHTAPRTTSARRLKTAIPRLPRLKVNGLSLAVGVTIVITAVLLFGLGGWRYYWAPLDVRAYTDTHRLLRPSGTVGSLLGIAGLSLMVLMHLYTLRKHARWTDRFGSLTAWLEFHIFCGVLGPVLITLHTSFKFNGVVSVAYWSMLVVLLSGFVGRYLYVRIPRSIRGRELTDAELAKRAADLKGRLATADVPREISARVREFEAFAIPADEEKTTWTGLILGEMVVKLRLFAWTHLEREHADSGLVVDSLALIAERAVLLRRIAYLKKTRRLFDLWRIYHKPLAILMAVIVILHVAIVAYLGYGWAL